MDANSPMGVCARAMAIPVLWFKVSRVWLTASFLGPAYGFRLGFTYKGSFKGPFKGIYKDSISEKRKGFRVYLEVHG